MVQIPKIIHQTWKTDEVPSRFLAYQASWVKNHPNWRYMLWTDEENRHLVASHYPWFLSTYDSYVYPIQKVDAARYFILHRFGGLYVDLDFECLRCMASLLSGDQCNLGLEPAVVASSYGRPKIISNALMASPPDHNFLMKLIEALPKNVSRGHQSDDTYVLETTGPFFLTNIFDSLSDNACVNLLPSKLVYPLTLEEADFLRKSTKERDLSDTGIEEIQHKLKGAYAVHHYAGTWWREM